MLWICWRAIRNMRETRIEAAGRTFSEIQGADLWLAEAARLLGRGRDGTRRLELDPGADGFDRGRICMERRAPLLSVCADGVDWVGDRRAGSLLAWARGRRDLPDEARGPGP